MTVTYLRRRGRNSIFMIVIMIMINWWRKKCDCREMRCRLLLPGRTSACPRRTLSLSSCETFSGSVLRRAANY